MQVHFRNTKKARAYREYLYGNRKDVEVTKPKKTRLDVLKERRQMWEKQNESNTCD